MNFLLIAFHHACQKNEKLLRLISSNQYVYFYSAINKNSYRLRYDFNDVNSQRQRLSRYLISTQKYPESGQLHRRRKQRRCQISDLIQHKGPIGVDEKKRRCIKEQQNLTFSVFIYQVGGSFLSMLNEAKIMKFRPEHFLLTFVTLRKLLETET